MRSLEDHLSPHDLASLPGSPEALASGGPDDRQMSKHLQQCEDCSSLAQTHWSLRSLGASANSATGSEACPEQTTWLELAAGLHPERTSTLLAHAAGCNNCADELRQAMQLMQPQIEPAQPDAEPIPGLASATPAWQRRLAAQMAAQMAAQTTIQPAVASSEESQPARKLTLVPATPAPRRRLPLWISLPAAAVLVFAAVLGGIGLYRAEHPSDARLLALAYNKQRTMALRIPGADPVPMASGTRGPGDAPIHGLSDPSELLELRLRAQQHLDQTPNSPYWHQVMGEIDLQEQDGLAARRNFEIAQATIQPTDPNAEPDLPNLQTDLAAAWFEIGDKSGNAESYAEAAELLSKQLHSKDIQAHPADAALLYYNRALCWERQSLIENALDDLRAALPLERSPAWRKAIEAEIARLSSHSATTPTDGYEEALDEATSKLLPLWPTSPEARAKIQATAALGLKHHDHWLLDWIAAKHTPLTQEADRHLASAVTFASAGDPESSLTESRQAMASYRQANLPPGLLRSELAETYALQRLTRFHDCFSKTNSLMGSPHLDDYSWLAVRSLEEVADCPGGTGNFDDRLRMVDRALRLSTSYDLVMLHLRAMAEQAEAAEAKGLQRQTWAVVSEALQRCNAVECPASTKFPLLYLLADGAKSLRLANVSAEIMRTATEVAAQTGNIRTQAYSLETLGILTGRIGDFQSSTQAFARASEVVHSGSQVRLAPSAEANWQTDRAEILSREGLHQAAFDLLQRNGPPILNSEFVVGRLHYLTQLATTQRALGKYQDALSSAWGAVREAELALPSLRSSTDRERWQQANRESYSELVSAYLQLGEETNALRAWERFRTASYQTPATAEIVNDSQPAHDSGQRVVVLARIGDEYVLWLAGTDPLRSVQVVRVPGGDRLQQTAATFYRLCSDPHSSLADIKAVGGRLYAALIEPLGKQTGTIEQLWIEPDPSLAMLPFAALTVNNGAWLSEVSEIAVVPPWWTLGPQSSLQKTFVNRSAHMVAVSGFGNTETDNSEIRELATSFSRATVLQGMDADPQAVLRDLPTAEVFHFSGHASAGAGPRMMLASGNDLSPEALASVHLSRCKLSVLAACNTTAEDPGQVERVPGLRDALLLAGSNSVIASTWDVDNHSTRALMSMLYRQLALGRSTTRSLKDAQQQVRSSEDWQHPYYWASFEVFNH